MRAPAAINAHGFQAGVHSTVLAMIKNKPTTRNTAVMAWPCQEDKALTSKTVLRNLSEVHGAWFFANSHAAQGNRAASAPNRQPSMARPEVVLRAARLQGPAMTFHAKNINIRFPNCAKSPILSIPFKSGLK